MIMRVLDAVCVLAVLALAAFVAIEARGRIREAVTETEGDDGVVARVSEFERRRAAKIPEGFDDRLAAFDDRLEAFGGRVDAFQSRLAAARPQPIDESVRIAARGQAREVVRALGERIALDPKMIEKFETQFAVHFERVAMGVQSEGESFGRLFTALRSSLSDEDARVLMQEFAPGAGNR